jgi:hypothetical protein
MKRNLILAIILPFFAQCQHQNTNNIAAGGAADSTLWNPYAAVMQIPLPRGFIRTAVSTESFGEWLRQIPLKKNKTVYLFNGRPKINQAAQFAVLDISVGHQDLQQCADAVMRLRAEYLYAHKRFREIRFCDNSPRCYTLGPLTDREHFDDYLKKVFIRCGTLSLQNQLSPVTRLDNMQIGDVFIKGGSPGHAMIVVDMAVNSDGKKIYLLAQSYMPAQSIHIVKNPMNPGLDPWYEMNNDRIVTPEWVFGKDQLRTW